MMFVLILDATINMRRKSKETAVYEWSRVITSLYNVTIIILHYRRQCNGIIHGDIKTKFARDEISMKIKEILFRVTFVILLIVETKFRFQFQRYRWWIRKGILNFTSPWTLKGFCKETNSVLNRFSRIRIQNFCIRNEWKPWFVSFLSSFLTNSGCLVCFFTGYLLHVVPECFIFGLLLVIYVTSWV